MSSFNNFGVERGTTIRFPATANLMVDSVDADGTNPWSLSITRNQSINNGFFTRIATTEVVLNWCVPNINTGSNTLIVDISGASGQALAQTITLSAGFYTVKQVLDALAVKMSDLSGTTGSTFTVVQNVATNTTSLNISAGVWKVHATSTLQGNLGMVIGNYGTSVAIAPCADLRLTRYIDFVSSELTYCQDLKDNSTALLNRDVLCRWYMSFDDAVALDGYGFPIRMGYQPFSLRRLFNPPKYIKWDNNAPLGNLSFQVYDENGNPVEDPAPTLTPSSWLMTLQMSEN